MARLCRRLSVALLACTVLCSVASLQAADSGLQIISFTSERCEPCRSMQPALTKLASEGWKIRQVDVQQHPQLVEHFKVQSLPTVLLYVDRQEVDRIVGAWGYQKLRARFESAAAPKGTTDRSANELLALVTPDNRWQAEPTTVRGQSPTPPPSFPLLNTASAAPGQARDFASNDSRESSAADRNAGQTLAGGGHANAVLATLASSSTVSLPSNRSVAGGRPTVDASGASQLSPVERAQAATVRIRIEDANSIAFGTGTVINMHRDQALVLTCGHLFRDISPNARLSVDVFDRGRPINVPAQVVSHTTNEGDIGLVEFRTPVSIEPVPVAALSEAPQAGAPAFSFGCDKGADPSRRDTQIKRLNRYLGPANIEIHGAPVVGRSGGGLFDTQGRLVGVCNAADNEDDEGIYAALPVVHHHLGPLHLSSPADNATEQKLASPTATPDGYWPDQTPTTNSRNVVLASSSTTPSASFATIPDATAAAATGLAANPVAQLHCVIRDATGREKALTIDRPSEQLLMMLQQSAR